MFEKATLNNTQKRLKELDIEFVDFKALDIKGKIHSLILPMKMLDENVMKNGIGFDASSYGFTKPEKSDMVMIPDLDTMVGDPFREKKTAIFFANTFCTDENRSRYKNDPRFIAEKAETALLKSKIGTTALFSPEFEFFIFKHVEFSVKENGCSYFLQKDSEGNQNLYHLASPDDEYIDFKDEAVLILQKMGIDIKYHHHEVAVNQHEIETTFTSALRTADQSVLIKYVLFNLAKKKNLFITFMPKIFFGKAGNGWHVHQYILDGKTNVFYEKGKYGNLSKIAMSYLTGLLYHSSSLTAFTNPSTNSFKRLVNGFEAPVATIFALSNRNAAIRIPTYVNSQETRIEYRAGDATSNPYLSIVAMLMAGISGIMRNLQPEKYNFGPFDGDLKEMKGIKNKVNKLPSQLNIALDCLEKDREFLKYENVMDDEFINHWIQIKRNEMIEVSQFPHPKEFELYFNF